MSPPSASSQARVRGEKNALGAFADVSTIEYSVGGNDHRDEHDGKAGTQRDVPCQPRRDQKDRRIDDVELLFDGKGPVVLQRRRRPLGGEVVRLGSGKVEVGQEQSSPLAVDRGRLAGQRAQVVVGRHDGDDDDQTRRRDDPARPASVEADERRASRCHPLPEEDTGDDEPGNDEEDIDADIATAKARYVGVKEDDKENGDGAETLDVGTKWPVTRCGPGFVAGGRVAVGSRPTSPEP